MLSLTQSLTPNPFVFCIAGLTMMWAGWSYGTGPKPPEAIAVATQLSAAYEAAAPARAALATAFNAVGPGKNCSKKNYAAAGGL